MKTCFFLGHRTRDGHPPLTETSVEQHIVTYDIAHFWVGHYGRFNALAAQTVLQAKQRHPWVTLSLLLPYLPTKQPGPVPEGFDQILFPSKSGSHTFGHGYPANQLLWYRFLHTSNCPGGSPHRCAYPALLCVGSGGRADFSMSPSYQRQSPAFWPESPVSSGAGRRFVPFAPGDEPAHQRQQGDEQRQGQQRIAAPTRAPVTPAAYRANTAAPWPAPGGGARPGGRRSPTPGRRRADKCSAGTARPAPAPGDERLGPADKLADLDERGGEIGRIVALGGQRAQGHDVIRHGQHQRHPRREHGAEQSREQVAPPRRIPQQRQQEIGRQEPLQQRATPSRTMVRQGVRATGSSSSGRSWDRGSRKNSASNASSTAQRISLPRPRHSNPRPAAYSATSSSASAPRRGEKSLLSARKAASPVISPAPYSSARISSATLTRPPPAGPAAAGGRRAGRSAAEHQGRDNRRKQHQRQRHRRRRRQPGIPPRLTVGAGG